MYSGEDLSFLLPEDGAFIPPAKHSYPSIAQLCREAKTGPSLIVFDLDGTILYMHSTRLSEKNDLAKIISSVECANFIKSNIKFFSQFIALIIALKAKGIYVALATCCCDDKYVKEVMKIIDTAVKGQAFDAFITGKINRDKAIVTLMQTINSRSPAAQVKNVVVVDDEQENLTAVSTSGKERGTQFVSTIKVDPISNQFLLDIIRHFKLDLVFSYGLFDSTALNSLYNQIRYPEYSTPRNLTSRASQLVSVDLSQDLSSSNSEVAWRSAISIFSSPEKTASLSNHGSPSSGEKRKRDDQFLEKKSNFMWDISSASTVLSATPLSGHEVLSQHRHLGLPQKKPKDKNANIAPTGDLLNPSLKSNLG